MDRSRKGPYLRAHNKLSLGLDRLLPAIAAVESSTLELMGPGQASASSVGFKESETKQLQARSTGGLRRVANADANSGGPGEPPGSLGLATP
jgi:hypothetical protein